MLFTAWIALSTRDLRDLTLQQAKDTQEGIKLTQKSVDSAAKQADASVILADAAKVQAETAKAQADDIRRQVSAALEHNKLTERMIVESTQSSIKQNQAYGSFLAYTTSRSPADNKVYADTNAVGHFQNVGSTPMTSVHIWSISGMVAFPFPNDVEPELMDENSRRNIAKFESDGPHWNGGATIGAGKVWNWPIKLVHYPLSDKEIEEYYNGSKIFYVEVVVWYKDTYGQRHKDKDCAYFNHEHPFDEEYYSCYKRRDKL